VDTDVVVVINAVVDVVVNKSKPMQACTASWEAEQLCRAALKAPVH